MNVDQAALRWLERAIGGSVVGCDALPGATSSTLYRIVASDASEYVLRLFTRVDWLALEPDLVAHEAAALGVAADLDLPTPRLVAASPEDVGFGAPAVLMTRVPGAVWLPDRPSRKWLAQLAAAAYSIHRHPTPAFEWRYRTWTDRANLSVPGWSRHASLWERAFAIVRGPAPPTATVFLHRDFHPTNVLWRDGELTGVVDWVNACHGPAEVDVSHCRTNLAAMYGAPVADRFLDAYVALSGSASYRPYWDIDSLLDWAASGPRFYEPWAHFGLASIRQETLRARMDDHLERIFARADDAASR